MFCVLTQKSCPQFYNKVAPKKLWTAEKDTVTTEDLFGSVIPDAIVWVFNGV
jgi:hypothetical protein